MRMLKGLLGTLMLLPGLVVAEQIGEVSTVFKIMGPNDKIVVEAFDDPKVAGVTCYLSRAKTGGVKGGLGLAEDRAEASIACRQVGPISFLDKLKEGEEVFHGLGVERMASDARACQISRETARLQRCVSA